MSIDLWRLCWKAWVVTSDIMSGQLLSQKRFVVRPKVRFWAEDASPHYELYLLQSIERT